MDEYRENEPLRLERKGALELVSEGKCAILLFGGQTHFYIPKSHLKKESLELIKDKLRIIFTDKLLGRLSFTLDEYEHLNSWFFELPPIIQDERMLTGEQNAERAGFQKALEDLVREIESTTQ